MEVVTDETTLEEYLRRNVFKGKDYDWGAFLLKCTVMPDRVSFLIERYSAEGESLYFDVMGDQVVNETRRCVLEDSGEADTQDSQ